MFSVRNSLAQWVRSLSKGGPPRCHRYIGCREYTARSIEGYGVPLGGIRALWRIATCKVQLSRRGKTMTVALSLIGAMACDGEPTPTSAVVVEKRTRPGCVEGCYELKVKDTNGKQRWVRTDKQSYKKACDIGSRYPGCTKVYN